MKPVVASESQEGEKSIAEVQRRGQRRGLLLLSRLLFGLLDEL